MSEKDKIKQLEAEIEQLKWQLAYAHEREDSYRKAILQDSVTYFEINVTKDEFITSAAQMVNGEVRDLFEFLKIPPFKKYTDYVKYWIVNTDEKDRDRYNEFFDLERLKKCYEKGKYEQIYESHTIDVFGRRRLCRYCFLLGKSELTGDIIALAFAKDITEEEEKRKILQASLREANAANVARHTFLSNMSHDIRTPLNSILGFAELLTKKQDEETIADYVDKIQVSGKQLLSIVSEALDVTWMESGRAALSEAECNLENLVEKVKLQMSPEALKKNIDFQVDYSGITHKNVITDPVRLNEIIYQLLDNAMKYTAEGGTVKLTVKDGAFAPRGYATYDFIVEDNGIGIDPKFQSRIFEMFERENNSTASGVFGSGLGLAVVRNIVNLMDGKIIVNSEPGKGSRFIVTMTLELQEIVSRDETATTKEPVIDYEALKGKRLLLVEDNAVNMKIAKALLKNCGFEIDTAENGQIAVDRMKEAKPYYYDAVLMDIQMPVLDGYEATRQIRHMKRKDSNLPIIAVSANAFAEDIEKSKLAGMDDHCMKPIDIKVLREMIGRVMMEKKRMSNLPEV